MSMMSRRSLPRLLAALLLAAIAALLACSDDNGTAPVPGPTRSYRMGFSALPPRNDLWTAIASIDMWSKRADAAIISTELPWDSLLAGVPPETLVLRDQAGLASYYRSKGHE